MSSQEQTLDTSNPFIPEFLKWKLNVSIISIRDVMSLDKNLKQNGKQSSDKTENDKQCRS